MKDRQWQYYAEMNISEKLASGKRPTNLEGQEFLMEEGKVGVSEIHKRYFYLCRTLPILGVIIPLQQGDCSSPPTGHKHQMLSMRACCKTVL